MKVKTRVKAGPGGGENRSRVLFCIASGLLAYTLAGSAAAQWKDDSVTTSSTDAARQWLDSLAADATQSKAGGTVPTKDSVATTLPVSSGVQLDQAPVENRWQDSAPQMRPVLSAPTSTRAPQRRLSRREKAKAIWQVAAGFLGLPADLQNTQHPQRAEQYSGQGAWQGISTQDAGYPAARQIYGNTAAEEGYADSPSTQLAAYPGSSPVGSRRIQSPVPGTVYHDPQHRFTVSIPVDWTTTIVGDGVQFARDSAYANAVVLEGNGTDSSLVAFLAGRVGKQWTQFQQITSGDCSFAGQKGGFAIYAGVTPQGTAAVGRIVATTASGKGYALIMSAPKSRFSMLRPALVEMERSFSLGDGQAAAQAVNDFWTAASGDSNTQVSARAKPEAPAIASRTIALQAVRKIFVAPMANDLDQYIRAEIDKQFAGRLTVVLNQESADGVLTGTADWQKGKKAAITGRWLGMHDTATGAVSLVSNDGNTVLWSSEAGDRSLVSGVMRRSGPRKVAERLVRNLKIAIEESEQ